MVRKQPNAVHLHRSRRATAPVVAALRRDGFGKLGLATSKSLPAQRDASPQEGVVEVARATKPVLSLTLINALLMDEKLLTDGEFGLVRGSTGEIDHIGSPAI